MSRHSAQRRARRHPLRGLSDLQAALLLALVIWIPLGVLALAWELTHP